MNWKRELLFIISSSTSQKLHFSCNGSRLWRKRNAYKSFVNTSTKIILQQTAEHYYTSATCRLHLLIWGKDAHSQKTHFVDYIWSADQTAETVDDCTIPNPRLYIFFWHISLYINSPYLIALQLLRRHT
jgi:hypothetical protein